MPYIGNVITSFAVETGNINDQAVTAPKLSATGGTDGQILALDSNLNLEWISDPAGQWVTSGSNIYYNNGNVGIGETSVSAGLDVKRDVNPVLAIDRGTANTANFNLQYNGTLTGQLGAASSLFQISAAGASTPMAFYANGAERMRIDTSGNVGIGTASPSQLLDLASTAPNIRLTDTVDGHSEIDGNAAILKFNADKGNAKASSNINFAVDNTERMRIDSSGNVGIGTSVIDERLHVEGSGTNERVKIENTTTGVAGLVMLNTNRRYDVQVNGSDLQVFDNTGSAERLRIDSSGRLLIGSSIAGNADADDINVAGAGNVGITFRGSSSGSGNIFFADSTSGDDLKRGQIVYDHSGNSMRLHTNAVERLRIDSSGRLLVGVSSTSAASTAIFEDNSASNGPSIVYLSSSSTTPADSAGLGLIRFSAANHSPTAQIAARRDGGTWTAGSSQPSRIEFSTTADGASSNTERMRIKSDGTLHVIKTGTQITNAEQTVAVFQRSSATGTTSKISIVSGNNAASHINFGDTDDEDIGQLIYNHSNNSMQFLTNTSERMRIDSSGNIGIGTTAAQATLDVRTGATGFAQFNHSSGNGGVRITGEGPDSNANLVFSNNRGVSTSDEYTIQLSGNNDRLAFRSGGTGDTERVSFMADGKVGIGTSSVDERLHIEGDGTNERIKIENTTSNVAGLVLLNTNRRYDVQVNGSDLQVFDNTGSAERLRVDSSGRVGIGITSPEVNLHTKESILVSNTTAGDGNGRIQIRSGAAAIDTSTHQIRCGGGTGQSLLIENQTNSAGSLILANNHASGTINFKTNSAERMRINSSGNVGIGTTSPEAAAHLRADGNEIKAFLYLQNRNGGVNSGCQIAFSNGTNDLFDNRIAYIRALNTAAGENGNHLTFGTNPNGGPPVERLRIDSSGRLLIGSTVAGNADADDINVAGSGNVGITLRGSNSGTGNIFFADGTSGDDLKRGQIVYDHSGNSMRLHTNAVERLRIDSSGRVGIGITSPAQTLDVFSSGYAGIGFKSNRTTAADNIGGPVWRNSSDQEKAFIQSTVDGQLKFGAGGATERMRINSSGNVGIGETSVGAGLDVKRDVNPVLAIDRGTANTANFNLQYNGTLTGQLGAANSLFQISAAGASTPMAFYANGAERMRIDTSGNVGIGTASAAQLLDLASTAPNIRLTDTVDGHSEIDGNAANLKFNADKGNAKANSNISFAVDNTERMRIDSSGNVGIGITSPSTKLHVEQASNGSMATFNYTSSTAGGAEIRVNNGYTSTVPLYGFWFNNSTGVGNPQVNTFSVITAGSEKLRVTNDGNVGIGTSSIDERLHVEGSGSNERIKIENTTSNIAGLVMLNTSRRYDIQVNGSDFQIFDNTGSADRLRIDSSGAVCIGRTTSVVGTNKLALEGDGTNTIVGVQTGATSAIVNFAQFFDANGTSCGGIAVNATTNTTNYVSTSDYRLKENIVDITGAIARFNNLAPKRFNFIGDGTQTTLDGFIAHEVQSVVPEAVVGDHNEVDADGNPVYQGIDQSKLVPLLTAALQEAIAKIETLETKVAALEAE